MVGRPRIATLFPTTTLSGSPRPADREQREGRVRPGDHHGDGGVVEAAEQALPSPVAGQVVERRAAEHGQDRKSTRLNSSHANISYAAFCLKKKNEVVAAHLA